MTSIIFLLLISLSRLLINKGLGSCSLTELCRIELTIFPLPADHVSISYITDNFLRLSLLKKLVAPSSTPLRCVVLAPYSAALTFLCLIPTSPHISFYSEYLIIAKINVQHAWTCVLDFQFLAGVPHCGFGCAALCQWAGELEQEQGWVLTH